MVVSAHLAVRLEREIEHPLIARFDRPDCPAAVVRKENEVERKPPPARVEREYSSAPRLPEDFLSRPCRLMVLQAGLPRSVRSSVQRARRPIQFFVAKER